MTIKKALEHFEFRLSNHWKPTPKDIEAYNQFVEYAEQNSKQQFNDYQLFAKIYISFYGELLRYYKASVFDKEPQIAINKILDTPIETLIEKFISKATDVEQAKEFTINGVLKHPKQLTKEEKDNIKIIEPVLSYEDAETNFVALINAVINKYK